MTTPADTGSRAEGPARWSLGLLGGFDLRALPGGETVSLPGKRERVLLAYLALSPNCRQPRRKLMTLLWGDGVDETTLDNLRTCMWRLRKTLDDTEHRTIASKDDNIVLDMAAFDVDAVAFRRLAVGSDRRELEAATSLYVGEFLEGLDIESEDFQSWRRAEATRYRDQAIEALIRLMTLLGEAGLTERASEVGLRILELDPLHEDAARRLMRLYSQTGRRGAAIQLYHALAARLRAELDTEPESETRLIFSEIARGLDRTEGPITVDAAVASRAANMARPSDAPGEGRTPVRAPFRLRAPLAVIAAALAVGVAFISYPQFAQLPTREAAVPEPTGSVLPTGAISIAVLPFSNLSGDAGQEFLSDGMTEEITAALAKVPGLRVVARTSAFQFKSQNKDIEAIARQLHASHIIEGSVRRVGDRVRITAQLIEASGGTHLWSETYDRQLTDIFVIQEDIARTITASLRVPLGLEPGENLVANRNIDMESYQVVLQARALWTARGLENLADSQRMFEQVLARYPNYAPAWAYSCVSHFFVANEIVDADPLTEQDRRTVRDLVEKAETACRRAVASDPDSPLSYGAAATLAWSTGRVLEGEELYLKALALDPNDANLLGGYGGRLAVAGRLKEALPLLLKSHALEPFAPVMAGFATSLLWLNGKEEEAIALAKTLRPAARANYLARIYASTGRFGEAADASMESPNANAAAMRETIRLLRIGPGKDLQSQSATLFLPHLEAGRVVGTRAIDFLYLNAGMTEPVLRRVLDNLESRADAGVVGGEVNYIWHPAYAPMRKTERFKSFMRKAGYVDYWRAKGWPQFCHPTTGDDFVCN